MAAESENAAEMAVCLALDGSSIAVCLEQRYQIFDSDTLKLAFEEERHVCYAEAAPDLSLVGAIVGEAHTAVVIVLAERVQDLIRLEQHEPVSAVHWLKTRLIVMLGSVIKIYARDERAIYTEYLLETAPNPAALLGASPHVAWLAYPFETARLVRVVHLLEFPERATLIEAAKSGVACLALSPNGELLATASADGTLIRVFRTSDGSKLFPDDLRRGAKVATIFSMAFTPDAASLVVVSDHRTIHLFHLTADAAAGGGEAVAVPSSSSSGSLFGFNFLSGRRANLKLELPATLQGRTSIVFSATGDTMYAIADNGGYARFSFADGVLAVVSVTSLLRPVVR